MGVYIKSMEIPPSCGDCRFCSGIADTDCGPCAWCDVDEKARVADTRQDCPLVHVPPHGRLIDADALAEEHRELAYELRGENYDFHMTARSWVNCAPTIIPAEEGE